MGYAQYRCINCGNKHRIAFTCKSCFCLSCAKPRSDQWVDFIGRRLLPGVTYRHIILTTPKFLRYWFYRNPDILSPFIRTGQACLLDVFKTCTGAELDIGTIIVFQTGGRKGNYNPHLHILVTAGGLNDNGEWKPVSYIPFEIIHRKWQYHLLTMLRENIADPAINKDIDKAWKQYPKGFVAHVQKGEVPAGGQGIARYLAKYVVSPPISIKRIESYDGKTVSYWYKDHKTGHIEHETLSALRFVGRMVQHILPKGFQRIRYYSLHSNVRYAKMRESIQQLLPTDTTPDPRGFRILPRKHFAKLFMETFNKNPFCCDKCGQIMELELIYHPKYGVLKDYFDYISIEQHDEQPKRCKPLEGRGSLERTERVLQVSMPFL